MYILLNKFLSFETTFNYWSFCFWNKWSDKLKLFRMNSLIALSTLWNEFSDIVKYTKDNTWRSLTHISFGDLAYLDTGKTWSLSRYHALRRSLRKSLKSHRIVAESTEKSMDSHRLWHRVSTMTAVEFSRNWNKLVFKWL